MIAVIDYQRGNLRSVANGLRRAESSVTVTDCPEDLVDADGIVLPGVGAFGEGMEFLEKSGFSNILNELVLGEEKPFLGICLGMQLMASTGEEFGSHDGLDWIPGTVEKIKPRSENHKVPHMGWNELEIRRRDPLFKNLGDGPAFYFLHSYQLNPADEGVVSSISYHGARITASVQKKNLYGVQFHPEKSQKNGLGLLENFVKFCI